MRRVFAAFASCLLASLVNADDVPLLRGRVVDNASLLSSAARERVRSALKAHENKTGNQLVLLTVPDLENDSIELYAVRVFNEWKLGEKGKDNGVLMVIVAKQRKARIEVGYGLEGSLPDVVAFRVIHNVMAPHLKVGHFDEGVEEGVNAIVSKLEGNAADSPRDVQAQPSVTVSNSSRDAKPQYWGDLNLLWKIFLIFMLILVGVMLLVMLALFAHFFVLQPGWVGWIGYLSIGSFIYLYLSTTGAAGEEGTMNILWIYLIAFPVAKLLLQRTAWYRKKYATAAPTALGASISFSSSDSDSSGGGSSSSDSGGDDFSGKGGRSGGGGSSDDYGSDDYGSDDRRDDSSDDDR